MIYLILCVCVIAGCVPATARVELVDSRGVVGAQVHVPIVFRGPGGEATVKGLLKLGNPTVFYPGQFVEMQAGGLLSSRLMRLTDSTWSFELHARYEPGDTVCALLGEALAGSDSLCTLALQNMEADSGHWPQTTATVSVTSVGTPLPYVRFARIEQNYPNPAVRGQTTTGVYRIDKASDVRIILYDTGGRTVDILELGFQRPGVYRVPYQPPAVMATGVYWARLVTSSGFSFQPFVVVP